MAGVTYIQRSTPQDHPLNAHPVISPREERDASSPPWNQLGMVAWGPPTGDVLVIFYYKNSSAKYGAWPGTTFPAGSYFNWNGTRWDHRIGGPCSNLTLSPVTISLSLKNFRTNFHRRCRWRKGSQSGKANVNEDDIDAVRIPTSLRLQERLMPTLANILFRILILEGNHILEWRHLLRKPKRNSLVCICTIIPP